ncbi:hypothetical protein BY996DRAFT_359215 [Phakopsora pachyrhizi]|nr:hypothetical protein BY996DRAFT_359215 [Phakopsora pachyrhizi]
MIIYKLFNLTTPISFNLKMRCNTLLSLSIFLIIFSLIHSANASLESAVEPTEAFKASGETKNSLEVEKKTTYVTHPQAQQEDLKLETGQQLIDEPHKNTDSNEPIREEKQSTELKSKNTLKVSEPYLISQQTPPVHQSNPSGDPYLSYLHHNPEGYQLPYLGAYDHASHYPSYDPQTAVPGSLLAQPTLTPDVNYVGPVVIPTVYDLFEYGYRQNYLPFVQFTPNAGHSVPGLENFRQSKGTGVYHVHFGGLPSMPPAQWKPSNEAESQLLHQQIHSEKVVPSNEKYIPKVRISKPLVKEKIEPSSNKQVSESRKEIVGELEKEKTNRSLQVDNNIYDKTHSKEQKKITFMDEKLNKQLEPKRLKTISTSKDNESTNQFVHQFNIHDSHPSPVDDSGQNKKENNKKIDSELKDARFYGDYPIQVGLIEIPTSRWRPRNLGESRLYAAQPAHSEKNDSSSKNILTERILNPSEKEKNKSLSENKVGETSKKTNIDKEKEKSDQTSPAPKKLTYNTHATKNKNVDEVDENQNELLKNQGLKTTSTSKEKESANGSVNPFSTHDLDSVPSGDSGQDLKGKNSKINSEFKNSKFFGDYSLQRGLLKIPASPWKPQNKAESQFYAVQPAESSKLDSSNRKNSLVDRTRNPSEKEKIQALRENQVGNFGKKTDNVNDKEKSNQLSSNYLTGKKKVKDADEKPNEQLKNQELKTTSLLKQGKKINQIFNQQNAHNSYLASNNAANQDLKVKSKVIFSQAEEDNIMGKDLLYQKTENSELLPGSYRLLTSRNSNKNKK